MHPSVDQILQQTDVTPEYLCEFSEIVTDCLKLRVGSISCKDPHAVQFHLDEIDAAIAEVSRVRMEAGFALNEVEAAMRKVQREYVLRPNLRPTQAERLYKVDEEHRELESSHGKLKAVVSYCDSTEDLLKNKYFEIKAKLRLS